MWGQKTEEAREKAQILEKRLDICDIAEEIAHAEAVKSIARTELDKKIEVLLTVDTNFGSDVQNIFYDRGCLDLCAEVDGSEVLTESLVLQVMYMCLPWNPKQCEGIPKFAADSRVFDVKQPTVSQLDGGSQYHRRIGEESLSLTFICKLISLCEKTDDAIILSSLGRMASMLCGSFQEAMEEEDTKLAKRLLICLRGTMHILDVTDTQQVSFYDKVMDTNTAIQLARNASVTKTLMV